MDFAKTVCKFNLLLRCNLLVAQNDDMMTQPCSVKLVERRVVQIGEVDPFYLRTHSASEWDHRNIFVYFRFIKDRIRSIHSQNPFRTVAYFKGYKACPDKFTGRHRDGARG